MSRSQFGKGEAPKEEEMKRPTYGRSNREEGFVISRQGMGT